MTLHVVGVDTDNTLRCLAGAALEAGLPVDFVNLRAVTDNPWRVSLGSRGDEAVLHPGDGTSHYLASDDAFFLRLVDLSPVLTEFDVPRWRNLGFALTAFFESASGPVVNRPSAQVHNGSKALHEAWLARRGIPVPESLTTSDPGRAHEFIDEHESVILKALCGARGRAQLISHEQLTSYEAGRGPLHLQRYVSGTDVRVHLVEGVPFAESIKSDAVDYRDAAAHNEHALVHVPEDLLWLMTMASAEMGLVFTGWDFRVDHAGTWHCLEVNPMPGYDVYDRRCGGAISRELCRVLSE